MGNHHRGPVAIAGFASIVLLVIPLQVLGHAGDMLDSIDVDPPDATNPTSIIESTIGLLYAENGRDYEWVCHEAVTRKESLITPRYHRSDDGYTLVVIPRDGEGRVANETLYRSTDHCNWAIVTGLTGRLVADAAIAHNAPTTAYVITQPSTTTTESGVWRSTDSGHTWTATALTANDQLFTSIYSATTAIWASAIDEQTRQAYLYRSTDGGTSWAQWHVDLASYSTPLSLEILDESSSGVWFRTVQTLTDDLWHLDMSESFATREIEGDTKLMSLATTPDGAVYVSMWNQGIATLTNGELVVLPNSPRSYSVRTSDNRLYAATRQLFTGQAVMLSSDRRTFERHVSYADVDGFPTCASDSHSAIHCEPLWDELSARLVATDATLMDTGNEPTFTPSPPPATTTGCFGSGPRQSLVFFLLPPYIARRFRRRRPVRGSQVGQ